MVAAKINKYLLIGIIILAAFLRLYNIEGYMTFLGDEGRDVLVVKRIIVDHKLTLLGPTASVGGFFLGPIYYYMMIPFLWAFRLNPVGPAVMVALFGVATVYLIYLTGRDFFNRKVGLLAAFLYATSPYIIAYSRSSWNPNLMPFFSLLIIYLTWKMAKLKQPKLLFLVGFLFGLAIQLHYLAVFLMTVVGVFLFIYFRRLSFIKHYFLGVIGFLFGWSPFLLFELRHNFPNFRTFYRFIFFGEETGIDPLGFLPKVLDVGHRLFSHIVTHNQNLLGWFLLAIMIFLLFFYGLRRGKKEKPTWVLLTLWGFIGTGLFGFYQKGIYDYYFGIMYGLPFLLTAYLIWWLWEKKFWRLVSLVIFSIIFFGNVKGIPFRYQPNRQLNQAKTIARFVFDKAEGKPFNFALITGNNSDHAYRYFLEIWGNSPITILNSQIDPERKSVTDQLLVVCESLPCSPLGHPLWEVAGFGRGEIDGVWNVSVLQVYKLKHWVKSE